MCRGVLELLSPWRVESCVCTGEMLSCSHVPTREGRTAVARWYSGTGSQGSEGEEDIKKCMLLLSTLPTHSRKTFAFGVSGWTFRGGGCPWLLVIWRPLRSWAPRVVCQGETSSCSFSWSQILILHSYSSLSLCLHCHRIGKKKCIYLILVPLKCKQKRSYINNGSVCICVGDTDLLTSSLYTGHKFRSCSRCLLPAVNDVPSWKSVAEWSFNSF